MRTDPRCTAHTRACGHMHARTQMHTRTQRHERMRALVSRDTSAYVEIVGIHTLYTGEKMYSSRAMVLTYMPSYLVKIQYTHICLLHTRYIYHTPIYTPIYIYHTPIYVYYIRAIYIYHTCHVRMVAPDTPLASLIKDTITTSTVTSCK